MPRDGHSKNLIPSRRRARSRAKNRAGCRELRAPRKGRVNWRVGRVDSNRSQEVTMGRLWVVSRRSGIMAIAAVSLAFSFQWARADTLERSGGDQQTLATVDYLPTVRDTADWAVRSGDSGNLPFVVIDKVGAMLFVFDADGSVRASTPVLLGLARGDHSVPGIGERPIADIKRDERTTPAGRFVGERGRNLDGEDIIWIDYQTGLAIHRLRPGLARERRPQRLASPTPNDNRISLGCVVTSAEFYENVIRTAFAGGRRMIYILPETAPAMTEFAQLLRG